MTAPKRTALYTPTDSAIALTACARHAESAGLRVVTMVAEEIPARTPLGGQDLNQLINRLADGEFEVILAHAAPGQLLTLSVERVPLRCAIYARCATAQGYASVSDQIGDCRAYAAKRGWEEVHVYRDEGVSGLKAARPGLDQLIPAAEHGAFDVLLVRDLERLGRDALHLCDLMHRMETLGVKVHTVATGAAVPFKAAMRYASSQAAKLRRRRNIGCAVEDLEAAS